MVEKFKTLVARGDTKGALKALYNMAEHEVVECLVDIGATTFYNAKSKTIESSKDFVIAACSKRGKVCTGNY